MEEPLPSDPYSRPSSTGYVKTPSSGGHSLSSLYEPLTFEEMYNSPKAKPMYSSGMMSLYKPGQGPPGAYSLAYGPPVEYHMPSNKGPYTTSSSPYSPSGGPSLHPKYKGPYRTVITGPSGYASPALHGYGYGKPRGSPHGNLLASSAISLASDMLSSYKTRGGGWAHSPPMMPMSPYYQYKYSTISHANIYKHPFEYENGNSEKYYGKMVVVQPGPRFPPKPMRRPRKRLPKLLRPRIRLPPLKMMNPFSFLKNMRIRL